MKIRKPLSLPPSLSFSLVYTCPNPRLGHGSRHPSPTLRPNVSPFRIGARVSLAIQIHFLHDITQVKYTMAVITVWRDCLHFSHIVEKRTLQRWLRHSAAWGLPLGVHCTGKVSPVFDEMDRWIVSLQKTKKKKKNVNVGRREGCGGSY